MVNYQCKLMRTIVTSNPQSEHNAAHLVRCQVVTQVKKLIGQFFASQSRFYSLKVQFENDQLRHRAYRINDDLPISATVVSTSQPKRPMNRPESV